MKLLLAILLNLLLCQSVISQINCTSLGNFALANETSGGSHVATGAYSLYYTNGAWDNSGFGAFSLYKNSTGYANSAFGAYSNYDNLTGYHNTSLGFQSLISNKFGFRNTSLGVHSLYNYNSSLEGNNTAMGYKSLFSTTTGGNNTAIGCFSGWRNTNGHSNTYIGGDNFNATSLNNVMTMGVESNVNVSNAVIIGDVNTSVIGGAVNWSTLSDKRAKKNISMNAFGLDFINQLNPVTYEYDYKKLKSYRGKESSTDSSQYSLVHTELKKVYTGFIAQEVVAASSNINFDFSGIIAPESEDQLIQLQYEAFIMPLINSIKELSEKNRKMADRIAMLKAKIKVLKTQVK